MRPAEHVQPSAAASLQQHVLGRARDSAHVQSARKCASSGSKRRCSHHNGALLAVPLVELQQVAQRVLARHVAARRGNGGEEGGRRAQRTHTEGTTANPHAGWGGGAASAPQRSVSDGEARGVASSARAAGQPTKNSRRGSGRACRCCGRRCMRVRGSPVEHEEVVSGGQVLPGQGQRTS